MIELHAEGTDLNAITGVDRVDLHLVEHLGVFKFHFDQAARERRGVDRRVDLIHQMNDRAGMIFVTMGDDHAAHHIGFIAQV